LDRNNLYLRFSSQHQWLSSPRIIGAAISGYTMIQRIEA